MSEEIDHEFFEMDKHKVEQSRVDCGTLYKQWRSMSQEERINTVRDNPLLHVSMSSYHVFAKWNDDDYQDWYPLDFPVCVKAYWKYEVKHV